MYTYGCVPICINGVVDMGVYEFQKDLIDAIIEKAFMRDESCKSMTDAWHCFGERMVTAVQKLLVSPVPMLPVPSTITPMVDEDEDIDNGASAMQETSS